MAKKSKLVLLDECVGKTIAKVTYRPMEDELGCGDLIVVDFTDGSQARIREQEN